MTLTRFELGRLTTAINNWVSVFSWRREEDVDVRKAKRVPSQMQFWCPAAAVVTTAAAVAAAGGGVVVGVAGVS
eukprot:4359242-Ditylum_brightwellii.AAC.1